jgi:transposase InsO family protein
MSVTEYFVREQIEQLAREVSGNNMTLPQAIQHVTDEDGNPLNISRQTFMRYCESEGIFITPHHGRPQSPVREDLRELIARDPILPGAMTEYLWLMSHGYNATRTQVYRAYTTENKWQSHPRRTKKVKRCRYVACQKDLIWHTDLHEVRNNPEARYIIGYIDDASRVMQYWDFLRDKTSASVRATLMQALNRTNAARPYLIWSDNGGEYMGAFDQFLSEQGIRHWTTEPYSPQQNGKIERFWQQIDGLDPQTIALKVDRYHDTPHRGLQQIEINGRQCFLTPAQAYNQLESWQSGNRSWKKNDVEEPFPV